MRVSEDSLLDVPDSVVNTFFQGEYPKCRFTQGLSFALLERNLKNLSVGNKYSHVAFRRKALCEEGVIKFVENAGTADAAR